MSRGFNTQALVLKRSNVGEADRIVTLFTQEQGKISAVAKGARQIKSTKRAYLEPGNHIKCSLVTTKGLPILTQATLISDATEVRTNLTRMRQMLQLLEITDKLFVEEHDETLLFDDILNIRNKIVTQQISAAWFREAIENVIIKLGYQPFAESEYTTITEYVAALSDRPLKTWEYLKVTQ